jgi:hypothetical protein
VPASCRRRADIRDLADLHAIVADGVTIVRFACVQDEPEGPEEGTVAVDHHMAQPIAHAVSGGTEAVVKTEGRRMMGSSS